jgi:phosphoribosylglycinamide formyltransferase-1
MNKLRIGVLVSGRGSNLQAIIDAIENGCLAATIAVVISDQPGAYALERAHKHGIPAAVVARCGYETRETFEAAVLETLKIHNVGLVALAGFMRILSSRFITNYPQRILNIHPALLPAFTGLHAQAQALAYGVKVSGCTVHFVDEGMDTGPIILQEAVPVWDHDTEETLSDRIVAAEHRIYPAALQLLASGRIMIEGRRVKNLADCSKGGNEGS